MSAQRIGRRTVISFMQGVFNPDRANMLDYGFEQIFHPDQRGSSAFVVDAERDDLVCFAMDRCVTAVLPSSGDVELISWAPDIDNSSIAVLDSEPLPKSALPPKKGNGQGPSGDVAVARLFSGPIVVANRKGASVNLSRWSIDSGGSLSLVADGIKMGPATTMDLQPVYSDMLLSVATDPDGVLVVKSWRSDGSSLIELDTYRDESRIFTEVTAAGPLTTDVFTGHRAVTAAIAPGVLVHGVWGVDETTGEISSLGELVQVGTRDQVEITPFFVNTVFDGELFPPVYYATTYRSGGQMSIGFYRISGSGNPVGEAVVNSGIAVEEAYIAPLGVGGVFTATRAPGGSLDLIAWDARRNEDNSISPDEVARHSAPGVGSLELAPVPSTHAEGDYVIAVTDLVSGSLSLRAFRSGDRPY
jgi:hypothetical protein